MRAAFSTGKESAFCTERTREWASEQRSIKTFPPLLRKVLTVPLNWVSETSCLRTEKRIMAGTWLREISFWCYMLV